MNAIISSYFVRPEELYDFNAAPDGLVNLIDVPEYQVKIQEMKKHILKEMKRTQDPIYDEFVMRFMD